ncbi:hypothetical protein F4553_001589 [Allocatelliglobosispora scoriae]|uniref:Uncharacterized protein n=1 Tax=Allocatelliglobosispora scoriae TaxID=643052 RepID=A0A841BN13_9ACTN|nr:hypothetical protein [Allocatelliglobosispora scoriae]MBB5868210.1 hypothetical protein [Allocatelliglobosispora scoriae]
MTNALRSSAARLLVIGRGWLLPMVVVLVTAILSGAVFAYQQGSHDEVDLVGAGPAVVGFDHTAAFVDTGDVPGECPPWACLAMLAGLLEDFGSVEVPAGEALLIGVILLLLLLALPGRAHRRSPSLTELCLSRT